MAFQSIMHFKQISYQRVKNLGNYESERLEVTAEVNDEEDIEDAIAVVRLQVLESLDIEAFEDDEDEPSEVAF